MEESAARSGLRAPRSSLSRGASGSERMAEEVVMEMML